MRRRTTLQKDYQQLESDIQAIQKKSTVTQAMQDAVTSDIQQLQKESTSAPDQTAVTTLSKDLAALNGATPDFTQGQLQTDLEAVIKSTGASDATLVTTLEHDLNAVATAMNVTPADVQTIQADQKAIASDGGPTAPGGTTADPLAGLEMPLLGDLLAGTQGVPGGGLGNGGPGGPGGPMQIGSSQGLSGFQGGPNGHFGGPGGGFGPGGARNGQGMPERMTASHGWGQAAASQTSSSSQHGPPEGYPETGHRPAGDPRQVASDPGAAGGRAE